MKRFTVEPGRVLRDAAAVYVAEVLDAHPLSRAGDPGSSAPLGCLLRACGFQVNDVSNFYVGDEGLSAIVSALLELDLGTKERVEPDVAIRWAKLVAAFRVVAGVPEHVAKTRVTFNGDDAMEVEAIGANGKWGPCAFAAIDGGLDDVHFGQLGRVLRSFAIADDDRLAAPSDDLDRLGAALDELERAGA